VIVTRLAARSSPTRFFVSKNVWGGTCVLAASIGGTFVPHGQTFWQHARARRHHSLRVNSFKEIVLLVLWHLRQRPIFEAIAHTCLAKHNFPG